MRSSRRSAVRHAPTGRKKSPRLMAYLLQQGPFVLFSFLLPVMQRQAGLGGFSSPLSSLISLFSVREKPAGRITNATGPFLPLAV